MLFIHHILMGLLFVILIPLLIICGFCVNSLSKKNQKESKTKKIRPTKKSLKPSDIIFLMLMLIFLVVLWLVGLNMSKSYFKDVPSLITQNYEKIDVVSANYARSTPSSRRGPNYTKLLINGNYYRLDPSYNNFPTNLDKIYVLKHSQVIIEYEHYGQVSNIYNFNILVFLGYTVLYLSYLLFRWKRQKAILLLDYILDKTQKYNLAFDICFIFIIFISSWAPFSLIQTTIRLAFSWFLIWLDFIIGALILSTITNGDGSF